MFTGFATENTPAIQVWDFFRQFANVSAVRSVSLTDDCAPIQVFRTGATSSSSINVYLPTAPVEGKQITIVNARYGTNFQTVLLFSSDTNGTGSSSSIYNLGAGQSIVLCYSKNLISFGTLSGNLATGWVALNQASAGAANYGSVGFGVSARATGAVSAVIGGDTNSASGTHAATLGGSSNTASGTSSVVIGGSNNAANSSSTIVIGGGYGTARSIIGNFVYPASEQPITSFSGAQQLATLLLGRQTTNATPTVLSSTAFSASTTNQVILSNNSSYTFQGTCIANVTTAGGDTSSWKFEGAIKRGATAASTTLIAAVTPTVIAQNAGAALWGLAITADITNGGIAVTVTGQAATTIRWVCKIETTEVTY